MASAAPEPERDSRRGAPEGQFGNVAHEYDEAIAQKVREMAASGCGWKTMSRILELSIPTLMKHYQRDFWRARSMASANVGQAVYKAAMAGSVSAQKFFLTRMAPQDWGTFDGDEPRDGAGGGQPAVPAADFEPAPVRLVFVKTPPPGKGSILPEDPMFLRNREDDDGEG